jgi:hypothetical protein
MKPLECDLVARLEHEHRETAIMPITAAIANAVKDAAGVRIKSLPITVEKVLEALKGH